MRCSPEHRISVEYPREKVRDSRAEVTVAERALQPQISASPARGNVIVGPRVPSGTGGRPAISVMAQFVSAKGKVSGDCAPAPTARKSMAAARNHLRLMPGEAYHHPGMKG